MADQQQQEQGNVKMEYNLATTGMNMDNTVTQVPKGMLTYALNAALENFDANSVNYQNEPGNEFCVKFPLGYKLIGTHFIVEQNKHIFFIVNPETGESQIGYMDNNDCEYRIYINAPCLNFNIDHPIHKVVHKITNCTTEIYWTDGYNPRRYLDLNAIPYIIANQSQLCDLVYTNNVDCNQLKLQPNFSIPELAITDIQTGGDLTAGTYQFAIQYSDAAGNPYTSYYSVTNPTPIADIYVTTPNFNYQVGKSIIVTVSNLDATGQFQYFNLAVIKTVNNITSVELAGTYFIDVSNKNITYTGQNVTQIKLTVDDIFEKQPYYEIAQDLTAVQDILVWDNLTSIDRINYQSIASQISLQWETYKLPANENYADELNATNLRGYLRDEVYAFEIVFLLKNGKQTDGFHIPGRAKNYNEFRPDVPNTNPDFIGEPEKTISGVGYSPYWKIYNTATVLGPGEGDPIGNATPYEYGEFAYWESTETYPCNIDLWGELANQPIRHHKFPDVLVSPLFKESIAFTSSENMVMQNNSVFPIGVKLDIGEVYRLIQNSNLTDSQKADIAAFKIVRGDRSTNKSIVAKGILRNVNTYKREEQTFYYPNYPYNDLGADPFINTTNNAWSQICEPFNVNVIKFNAPIGNPTYMEVEYTDCNSNKRATIKYDKLGLQDILCSISKPVILGPGVTNSMRQTINGPVAKSNCIGTVGYANYDVWEISVKRRDFLNIPRAGWRAVWDDPISGPNTTQWVAGYNVYSIHTMSDTVPGRTDENNTDHMVFKGKVRVPDCKIPTPITPISSNATLAYRQIFNSPETSFGQPFLGNILKLENVVFGRGHSHFVQVQKNAKYKLLTYEAQRDALISSQALVGGTNPFDATGMFTAYQAYLTIYINGITRKNYAYSYNSIASYDYAGEINNDLGIKQRSLDIARYLIPGVQNVGDDHNVNNWNRESSVYLKTTQKAISQNYVTYNICNTLDPIYTTFEGFKITNITTGLIEFVYVDPALCISVNSLTYPIALNPTFPYTITVTGSGTVTAPTISLPLPSDTPSLTVGGIPIVTDESRHTISEIGNCSVPAKETDISVVSYYGSLKNLFVNQWGQIYSYDTVDTGFQRPTNSTSGGTATIFGGDTFISRFAFKTKLPFFIDNRVGAPDDSDIFYDEIGNVGYPAYWHSARSILKDYTINNVGTLSSIISYKAHNFDCPNSQLPGPPTVTAESNPNRTFYDGYFYLFAYGIPNFYCETSINTNLRQAFNNKEGDFWPHVSTSIPDDWLQEFFVTIAQDNTYYYNVTYSRQNKENFFSHLPPDWKAQLCYTTYPFRAIYSDTASDNADNRVNNWLTYRPIAMFDFPQNYGKLVSLDGIQNRAILARFENKSLLYNTMLTVQTSNPQAAYLGNDTLFRSAPPIDFAETDLGYVGSQNKFLLKIPQGQITVDAKRGQVFLIAGNQASDLSAFGSGMNRFFTDHLAFEILRHFPDVDIDNHFNGIGLHGVYDSKYDRVIISKLDYIPLSKDVKYDAITKEFYTIDVVNNVDIRTEVYLSDEEYFCNKSWTLSYNVNTKSWVSFHSYIPNWYIAENNFFYSGVNGCCDDLSFEAFVGNGIIITTTTTTTTPPPPTTTTSTTTVFIDCFLGGNFFRTACSLHGTGIITVPATTTTTMCQRPTNLDSNEFTTGYLIIDDSTIVNSTGSFDDACNAIGVINSLYYDGNTVPSIEPITISFSSENLELGATLFYDQYSMDCTLVSDGWYSTNESGVLGFVYQVSGGVIIAIEYCFCGTTTTTTTIINIPECCGIIYSSDVAPFYYDVDNVATAELTIPGFVAAQQMANTSDKFWELNGSSLDEWDVTLAPFLATFNRNIAFPGGYSTTFGFAAISDTVIIGVDDSVSPYEIVELDVTGLTAAVTSQFVLPADVTPVGNMLYTTTGKLILIIEDDITSDYYVLQYDYATGILELQIAIPAFTEGRTPTGLFECNCIIYITDTGGYSYVVDKIFPYTILPATLVSTPIESVTQTMSCVTTSFELSTTTTTTTTV